eukprot:GAHX01003165.1.p1 GENE.GAHX01003165.1~~GAHX01003165.1.p1  ORF type:complete len:290 (-),score=73.93 GAHX01003165.1:35-904(-)
MPPYKPKQPIRDRSEDEETFDIKSEATSNPAHSATDFDISTGLSSVDSNFKAPLYNKRVTFPGESNKLSEEYRNLRYKLSHLKDFKHVKDAYPIINSLKDMCSKLYKEYKITSNALDISKSHQISLTNQNNEYVSNIRQEQKDKSRRYKTKIKKIENENEALSQTNRENSDQLTTTQGLIKILKEEKDAIYSELHEHKQRTDELKFKVVQEARNLETVYKHKIEEFKSINNESANKIKELERELYKYKGSVKYTPNESFENIHENDNSNVEISHKPKKLSKRMLDFLNK